MLGEKDLFGETGERHLSPSPARLAANRIAFLESQRSQLQEKLDAALAQIEELQDQIRNQTDEETTELKLRVAQLEAENEIFDDYRKHHSVLLKENCDLKLELQDIQQKVDSLSQNNFLMKNQIQKSSEKEEEFQKNILLKDQEINKLQEVVNKMEEKLDVYEKERLIDPKYDESSFEVFSLKEENVRLMDKIQKNESKFNQCFDTIKDQLKRQIANFRKSFITILMNISKKFSHILNKLKENNNNLIYYAKLKLTEINVLKKNLAKSENDLKSKEDLLLKSKNIICSEIKKFDQHYRSFNEEINFKLQIPLNLILNVSSKLSYFSNPSKKLDIEFSSVLESKNQKISHLESELKSLNQKFMKTPSGELHQKLKETEMLLKREQEKNNDISKQLQDQLDEAEKFAIFSFSDIPTSDPQLQLKLAQMEQQVKLLRETFSIQKAELRKLRKSDDFSKLNQQELSELRNKSSKDFQYLNKLLKIVSGLDEQEDRPEILFEKLKASIEKLLIDLKKAVQMKNKLLNQKKQNSKEVEILNQKISDLELSMLKKNDDNYLKITYENLSKISKEKNITIFQFTPSILKTINDYLISQHFDAIPQPKFADTIDSENMLLLLKRNLLSNKTIREVLTDFLHGRQEPLMTQMLLMFQEINNLIDEKEKSIQDMNDSIEQQKKVIHELQRRSQKKGEKTSP